MSRELCDSRSLRGQKWRGKHPSQIQRVDRHELKLTRLGRLDLRMDYLTACTSQVNLENPHSYLSFLKAAQFVITDHWKMYSEAGSSILFTAGILKNHCFVVNVPELLVFSCMSRSCAIQTGTEQCSRHFPLFSCCLQPFISFFLPTVLHIPHFWPLFLESSLLSQ